MNLDSITRVLVTLAASLAVVAAPVTAGWVISNSLSALGTRITVLEGKMDAVGEKVDSIDEKLDLIISGLDIRVEAAAQ